MDKLKDLFTESYIEVPESKVDLVDELSESVEELESKLNETTQKLLRHLKNWKFTSVKRLSVKRLVTLQRLKSKN